MPTQRLYVQRLIAWSLYDWACSAFFSIIQTFLFASYFVQRVASDPTTGFTLWGLALGGSGLLVAFGGPILGAHADRTGRQKQWLGLFTILSILCSALLWFVQPALPYVGMALLLAGGGSASLEFAYIFYNALLPRLAAPEEVGRWSGWGWALGYIGGMTSLFLCLILFLSSSAWISLSSNHAQNIRACFLLVALWQILFSLPLFLLVPASPTSATSPPPPKLSLWQQWVILFKEHRNSFKFLIGRMFYSDGLITLFSFGGIYASAAFGLKENQIIFFGISLNISAGIGCALFALLDDYWGGRKMILLSLLGLLLTGALALSAPSLSLFWFWALCLGLFVGPVQSSSRSYLARMTPTQLQNQMFGFFALSSKATAFMGPLLVSGIIALSGSIHLGVSSILLFFLIGFLILLSVKPDKTRGTSSWTKSP